MNYIGDSSIHGSKVLPVRLIEATLGRPVDAAVVATQSTPEILENRYSG